MKPVPAPIAFTGDISNLLGSIWWVCAHPEIEIFFAMQKFSIEMFKINFCVKDGYDRVY